jgi:two-component system LytT family response regulator
MRPIRTLIVDDEPLAREGIALMLERDPEVEVIGACGDGQAALEAIRTQRPDLAFVDIHMPRLNGLDAIEQLPAADRPAVIFVTAHDQYAVRAFGACAVDYLLKPFRDDRFQAALTRAKAQVRRARDDAPVPAAAPEPANRLVFKAGSEYIFISPDDLIWIEAQGNFVKLAVAPQTHLVREPLQSVEERLDPRQFVRVHRSFLINARHIRRIMPILYGDYQVLMSDGTKIRMSRSYRDKLKALLPPNLA